MAFYSVDPDKSLSMDELEGSFVQSYWDSKHDNTGETKYGHFLQQVKHTRLVSFQIDGDEMILLLAKVVTESYAHIIIHMKRGDYRPMARVLGNKVAEELQNRLERDVEYVPMLMVDFDDVSDELIEALCAADAAAENNENEL
jgi:hypothetical protein